jgi:hypothetical protein
MASCQEAGRRQGVVAIDEDRNLIRDEGALPLRRRHSSLDYFDGVFSPLEDSTCRYEAARSAEIPAGMTDSGPVRRQADLQLTRMPRQRQSGGKCRQTPVDRRFFAAGWEKRSVYCPHGGGHAERVSLLASCIPGSNGFVDQALGVLAQPKISLDGPRRLAFGDNGMPTTYLRDRLNGVDIGGRTTDIDNDRRMEFRVVTSDARKGLSTGKDR